jgi:signal transduction histidine kinase
MRLTIDNITTYSRIGVIESDVCEEPARESSSHSKTRSPRVDDLLVMLGQQLRDRLNSIIGFSDLIAHSDQLSEGHRRYAAHIQSSSRALMGVLTDILALARCICELTEASGVDVRVVSRPDGEMGFVTITTPRRCYAGASPSGNSLGVSPIGPS